MMKMNKVTVRDTNMLSNLNKFTEDFAGMSVLSILNYFSEYNNFSSYEKLRDMTAIAILLRLLKQIMLLQEAMNSVTQCQRTSAAILKRNISHGARVYINNILIRESKTRYENKKTLSEVKYFIFEHLKTLDQILISIELFNIKVFKKKSQFCQSKIIIIRFSCDFDERYSEVKKIAKIVN